MVITILKWLIVSVSGSCNYNFIVLQVTVVAMLINSNADWNAKDKDGDTVLHFSCMNQNPGGNHLATLRFLLTTPAKSLIDTQNTRGDTPLHVAIRYMYVQYT